MGNEFTDFLLMSGLYDTHEINESNIADLIELVDGKTKIDCFCKECQQKRVFSGIHINHFWLDEENDRIEGQTLAEGIRSFQSVNKLEKTPNLAGGTCHAEKWKWINWQIEEDARLMVFKFVCSMNQEHHLDFVVMANQEGMTKIGQYPSVADLDFPELKAYQKIISKDDMKELKRAIGLNAQGIGVGSYVYLRRIIERLIVKAQEMALSEGTIEKETIEGIHVADRIKELKGYLPDMLVGNAVIYGIVSKGIHELSEEECMSYFPILKESILMILEKWENERQRVENEKRLSASLAKISGEIK